MATKVTSNGQVTVPKRVREAFSCRFSYCVRAKLTSAGRRVSHLYMGLF